MDTKKNEVIMATANPMDMKGKYLAERVVRSWMEDFVDEDNGEVVSIQRNEVIMERGTLLENENISSLMFYIQSRDIECVKVSNQRREGVIIVDGNTKIWSAVIGVGKKNVKLLLHANSFDIATEIIKDYVELNYSGLCQLTQLKEFGSYIVVEDAFVKENDEADKEKKLYKIEVNIVDEDCSMSSSPFLVFACDVESSMTAINHWISKTLNNEDRHVEFSTTIESAVIIQYSAIIDEEFSQAYMNTKKNGDD